VPLPARARGAAILALNEPRISGEQGRAVSAPLDAPLAIRGATGTGKTTALLARLHAHLDRLDPGERIWLTSPCGGSMEALRERLAGDPRVTCAAPAAFALDLVRQVEPDASIADDVYAAVAFENAAAELVDESWTRNDDVDPEVSGIRSPQRFRAQAFRLFRKLRANGIEPDRFEQTCRRGLTEFYANPPNFTSTKLLLGTQEQYRDSLFVDAAELDRQRLREADLIKVLAALYRRYIDAVVNAGVTIDSEVVLRAVKLLREGRILSPVRAVYCDDAQDLSAAELELIKAAGGTALTFAGDREQATRTFAGRSTKALEGATAIELNERFRTPAIAKYRPSTQALEALRLAEDIRTALASGTPPAQIAVLARGLRGIEPYLDALFARGIHVSVAGALDLFAFPEIEDVLGALWSVADPYRHDWTMRNLEAPWLNLSDAAIAHLCSDPPDAQVLLFELPDEIETSPSRRSSGRARMLRFGRNFVRGDADAALDPEIRERLQAFRAARERWERLERSLDLASLVETVAAETVLASASGSRAAFVRDLVTALSAHARRFTDAQPLASLHDYLLYTEAAGEIEDELVYVAPRNAPDAVTICDIETAKGREFADVFIVNVRAGAFPRWYVPDAFLFYPKLGIVAKENVGEGARAARTAKFTFAMADMATRERYCEEERRAFRSAVGRASGRVTAMGWGTPTRGISAPELLNEV
jgi:superfamily I DNA/RNA helicase